MFSNSLNWGVFHLLIDSHKSRPFNCCREFVFETLLYLTNFSLQWEPKNLPSVSHDQVCRHLHSLVQSFPPRLALALPSLLFSLQIIGLCLSITVSVRKKCWLLRQSKLDVPNNRSNHTGLSICCRDHCTCVGTCQKVNVTETNWDGLSERREVEGKTEGWGKRCRR
jgi:hypothetical protein